MALEASLRNKRVLITGAGAGIGRALAVRLHSYGSKILALDKDATSLASLKSHLPGAETVQVDLADWNGTRAAVEAIGPVDSLVNNAAILIGDGFFNIQPLLLCLPLGLCCGRRLLHNLKTFMKRQRIYSN